MAGWIVEEESTFYVDGVRQMRDFVAGIEAGKKGMDCPDAESDMYMKGFMQGQKERLLQMEGGG